MRKNYSILVILIAVLLLTGTMTAQPTSFSYQGRLTEAGAPANGPYNFEFRLFDAPNGGALIGTRVRPGTQVTNGVFNVALDFGPAAFPGADRWLEISVQNGGGPMIALTPRQQIFSSPYSIKASVAANADNASNALFANNSAQLGGVGADGFIQNGVAPQNASFNISGNGTIAGNLTIGGAFSPNIVNAQSHFSIGGVRVFRATGLGSGNTLVGIDAGAAITTGTDNAFFGWNAGTDNKSGSSNSFFGSDAGSYNDTGSGNTFAGTAAGKFNINGSTNSFFGIRAGFQNSSGSDNTFIGVDAGFSNGAGNRNSFFGRDAGKANMANENVFVGFSAGSSNTTGTGNSFFGVRSGAANVTGFNNTYFGYEAGLNSTVGENALFGHSAGKAVTLGDRNAFFGVYAGENTTTGCCNTFLGNKSGRSNTEGRGNVFVGGSAGFGNAVGSRNTYVGDLAGSNAGLSNGNNNTFLGSAAGSDIGNLTYASAIGSNSVVSSNDTIVLGKVAGTYQGQPRPADTVIVNGNLGVGTSTPLVKLDIRDSDVFGNAVARIQSPVNTAILSLDSTIGGQNQVWNVENGVFGTPGLFSIFDRTAGISRLTIDTAGTVTVPGNLTVNGTLGANIAASSITGVLDALHGGTGISSPGPAGNFLRSNGAAWTSAPMQAGDVPDLSTSYIRNTTTAQSGANFNVAGTGTANIFNAATQYNIAGQKFISAPPLTGNTVVGFLSGTATTGGANTIVGFQAGEQTTGGTSNSFFGFQAGQSTTTADGNSFFGQRAGVKNTAPGNAFFGWSAGSENTTGVANAYFGTGAGANLNGTSNSIFGHSAGSSLGTGSNNAIFGYFAGVNNGNGNNNVFVGSEAGKLNQGASDNTFVGFRAGLRNQSGTGNTMLGAFADVALPTLTNATAIGARAFAFTSNSIILGSISGVNGASSDTNVGIGVVQPSSKLHLREGDLFIESAIPALAVYGVILTSPNGSCFRITVADTGSLTTTSVACPPTGLRQGGKPQ